MKAQDSLTYFLFFELGRQFNLKLFTTHKDIKDAYNRRPNGVTCDPQTLLWLLRGVGSDHMLVGVLYPYLIQASTTVLLEQKVDEKTMSIVLTDFTNKFDHWLREKKTDNIIYPPHWERITDFIYPVSPNRSFETARDELMHDILHAPYIVIYGNVTVSFFDTYPLLTDRIKMSLAKERLRTQILVPGYRMAKKVDDYVLRFFLEVLENDLTGEERVSSYMVKQLFAIHGITKILETIYETRHSDPNELLEGIYIVSTPDPMRPYNKCKFTMGTEGEICRETKGPTFPALDELWQKSLQMHITCDSVIPLI